MKKSHSAEFDLIVIGGGSAGVRLARRSAGYGARVAVIESRKMGGTCVHLGCVPKKMFYYTAGYAKAFADAQDYGWQFSDQPRLNWSALIKAKDTELNRLARLYQKGLDEAGVITVHGKARFVDDNRLEVVHEATGNMQILSARRFAITVGGKPFLPQIPGIEYAKTSDDIFSLQHLPDDITIVGSGYIAIEFACIFAYLGVQVRLVYRGQRILKYFDQDLTDFVSKHMQAKGISFHPSSHIKAIEAVQPTVGYYTADKYKVICDDQEFLTDCLLYATGRVANTSNLGLENLSKNILSRNTTKNMVTANNRISVKPDFQSDIDHIYALGDVIDKPQLTPIAIAQANYLATHLFSSDRHAEPPDYRWLPTAIFSRPSIATIGLSEQNCIAEAIKVTVYIKVFTPLQHSLTHHKGKVMIKLIVAEADQRILGLHMAGAEAPDIIQAIAPGLSKGLTKQDLESTLALHPTNAEEILHFYPQHLVRTSLPS